MSAAFSVELVNATETAPVRVNEAPRRDLVLVPSTATAKGASRGEHVVRATQRRVAREIQGQHWLAGGDLLFPVPARITAGEGALVATNPDTGIFGVGDDLPSALLDLRSALMEHRDALLGDDTLSEELRAQLAYLKRHIRS